MEEEEAAGDAARPPRPHVPSNLVLAIVTTFVCGCVPLGVVAIVYAAQVQGKLDRGDIQGARAASSTARTLSLIGIIGMVVIAFGYAMLMFATVSVHD